MFSVITAFKYIREEKVNINFYKAFINNFIYKISKVYVFFIVFFSKSFPRISKMDIYINVQKRNMANLCCRFFKKKTMLLRHRAKKIMRLFAVGLVFLHYFLEIIEKTI